MHPMVNTNMSLEAIFSVLQDPLDIGKAIIRPVYDYEVQFFFPSHPLSCPAVPLPA